MGLDELSGKVSLVTGASRGIGRAIAIALGEEGVDVAVNYLTQEGAAQETCERVRAHRRRAVAIRADVSQAGGRAVGEDRPGATGAGGDPGEQFRNHAPPALERDH